MRRRWPRRNVRFIALSLDWRRAKGVRTFVKHGAITVSAMFYVYALVIVGGVWADVQRPPAQCEVPTLAAPAGTTPHPFSGLVSAAELPWTAAPPASLVRLWEHIGTDALVAAYRITLPNPMWDERNNVATAAAHIAGTVMAPGEVVSVIGTAGPFTKARGYGDGPGYAAGRVVPTVAGGVCKIGTAMYNAAIHGDLTVVERHPHSMTVPYAPAGRDAAIATGHKDVRIRNDHGHPVLLWAGMEGETLFIAVYGRHNAPHITWHHEELRREPAPLHRREHPDLAPGEQRIVFTGYDGLTVRTSITVERPGREPEHKQLSVDSYRPLPGVIEFGP